MMQWININWKIDLLQHFTILCCEKNNGSILPLLVSLMACWQVKNRQMLELFYSLQVKLFEVLLHSMLLQCYQLTLVGFSQVKLILRHALKCKKYRCHFSFQSLLLILSTLYHIAGKLSEGKFGKSSVISQTKTI